ncbi:MAG: hypothetical protein U1E73_00155 [Planctomycetota bacterium]
MSVFTLFSLRAEVCTHAALAQPCWLGAGADLLGVVPIAANGYATFQGTIPNTSWLRDARVFFHGLLLDGSDTVQVAPPLPCPIQ